MSMAEQPGAEASKVQLHLRLDPVVLDLLDACRGAATRPAFAALVLDRALRQEAAERHGWPVREGPVPELRERAGTREPPAAEPGQRHRLEPEPAPPPAPPPVILAAPEPERWYEAVPEQGAAVREAGGSCKHPGVGKKMRCPKCGRYNL